MIRRRWIAGALLASLGFVSGCSHSDCGGSMWDRLCSRTRGITTSAEAPCSEGPLLEDAGGYTTQGGCANGNCATPGGLAAPGGYPAPGGYANPGAPFVAPVPQQQPIMPPAGQSVLPPLAPTPRPTPQAQPVPAEPTASTKTR